MKFEQHPNFIHIDHNFLVLTQDDLAVLLSYFNVLSFNFLRNIMYYIVFVHLFILNYLLKSVVLFVLCYFRLFQSNLCCDLFFRLNVIL